MVSLNSPDDGDRADIVEFRGLLQRREVAVLFGLVGVHNFRGQVTSWDLSRLGPMDRLAKCMNDLDAVVVGALRLRQDLIDHLLDVEVIRAGWRV